MKRLVFLVGVLAAAMTAAAAMAAPAPKATGDYGYSYGGVQRHLTFNAIQSTTNTCGTFWNVSGTAEFTFDLSGTPYVHNATLTQNGQSVGGSGGYAGLPANTWVVNSGSTVIGNSLELTWNYVTPPELVTPTQIVMTMHGTIAANGSISGTWSQTGGAAGTFAAPAETATATEIYCGKGTAYYTDENGLWYFMNVKAVSVDGTTAWYAAQVIASNFGFENAAANYLFVKVIDYGEPGIGFDVTSGDVMTESAALAAVAGHGTPSASAVINEGNIQVH